MDEFDIESFCHSIFQAFNVGYYRASDSAKTFTPLTLKSDQDRISPYNINTVSSRQVMRIKENIN